MAGRNDRRQYPSAPMSAEGKILVQAREASDANTLLDCIAKLTIPCASQVILKENIMGFYLF